MSKSASELLRGLEERRARATSQGKDWVFDPEAHRAVSTALSAALPELRAVVEAAEAVIAFEERPDDFGEPSYWQGIGDCADTVEPPLAALREKLEQA